MFVLLQQISKQQVENSVCFEKKLNLVFCNFILEVLILLQITSNWNVIEDGQYVIQLSTDKNLDALRKYRFENYMMS